MSEAQVRARHLQDWLGLVSEEPEPWSGRFRQALAPEVAQPIEAAGRSDWLPVALHVKLAETLAASFGPARAHDYYRRAMGKAVRGVVLGPLVRTGTRLLGLTPASFLRWAAHGWKSSFRDCGSLSGVVIEAGRGRLIYENLPEVCAGSSPWVESAQGSAYGVYDLTGVGGVVRLDTRDLAHGRFELQLEWIDRRPR
jgi:hypothetical protein